MRQSYLGNVDNIDRGEPYKQQFFKVPTVQFVSETFKYNFLKSLKGKYVINNIQPSLPSPVGKSLEIHSSSATFPMKIYMQTSALSPIRKIIRQYKIFKIKY